MASEKAARQAKRQTDGQSGTWVLDLPGNQISCVSLRSWNVQFSCLDALRMAGLQPRFRAGSRQAKAWLSNELAVIDGVPRLSGPSHHTPAALWPVVLCIQYKVQHSTSTQAGTPQLPKMSPFQGCEPARPYCTVLRTSSPTASSTFLEPRQCFIPRARTERRHRESL